MTGPNAGVDVGFREDGLQHGANAAGDTAAAVAPLVARLAGLTFIAGLFGRVDQAEPLAAALDDARTRFQRLGEQVRDVHAGLAERARSTGRQGDHMVEDTTRAAPQSRAGR
jgi:hypothetical protein